MKTRIAGAALAAVMACGWASGAQAYGYTVQGIVTVADGLAGLASVGDQASVNIYFSPNDPFSITATFYDLTTGASGGGDGAYGGNGSFSGNGASIFASDASGAFGTQAGSDGGFGASFTLVNGSLPVDPKSFGPKAATGNAGISANPFGYDPDTNLPDGGFDFEFKVTSVETIGYLPAVPLPSSAPMFVGAVLALGFLSRAWKLRSVVIAR